MCFHAVKWDSYKRTHRDKCLIIVLCNHGDRYWDKNKTFTPVILYSSLCQLTSTAIKQKRRLRQWSRKKTFCNATLINSETTNIKPPIGCSSIQPDELCLLKHNLYDMQCIPRHRFDKLTSTLNTMGLKDFNHNTCLFTGYLILGGPPIYIGQYVDNFVYFSESDTAEENFHTSL